MIAIQNDDDDDAAVEAIDDAERDSYPDRWFANSIVFWLVRIGNLEVWICVCKVNTTHVGDNSFDAKYTFRGKPEQRSWCVFFVVCEVRKVQCNEYYKTMFDE